MATNRSRIHRPQVAKGDVKPDQLEDLLRGYVLLPMKKPVFKNETERRRVWEKNREYIFSLQGQKCRDESFGLNSAIDVYFELFKRPAAWWDFEAPEPRRMLTGDPTAIIPEDGLRKGIPRCFRSREEWQQMVFESEKDFLIRHGLLTELEKWYLKLKK